MNKLNLTAASMALIAILGSAALAQDTAPASTDLPAALKALNLSDIEIDSGKRGGRKIEADLPGGGEIDAFVDPEGALRMVRTEDAAVPQALIDELLPQAVRGNDILSQFAVIEAVGGRDGHFMVVGTDADGEKLRAAFDADGRMVRFGRGDDMHERDQGKHGKRDGHMKGRKGERGERGEHGKRGDRGRDMGPKGGEDGKALRGDMGRPGDMGPRVDPDQIRQKLSAAGYRDLGDPRRGGPRLELDGVNAAGEPVTIEIDPSGEVLREVAR